MAGQWVFPRGGLTPFQIKLKNNEYRKHYFNESGP